MILVNGKLVPIAGLDVTPPASHGGSPWARLSPDDYRARKTTWVRQVIVHTTKGMWPQSVKPGSGAAGRCERVAEFWHRDPEHSAALLVVGSDGSAACLGDLVRDAAYHATMSNEYSVGIEIYQESDGSITEAAYDTAVRLTIGVCDALGIPLQMPAPGVHGVIDRMALGGKDCVGVFGHRHNTHRRGRGDPGDEIFLRLESAGAEILDYGKREDLQIGCARQIWLNAADSRMGLTNRPLTVDGVCGPASMAAMRRHGFARWADVA